MEHSPPQLSDGAAQGCVAPDEASTQPFQRRIATLSENDPGRDPGRIRFRSEHATMQEWQSGVCFRLM
jgi:hypothetical protein